ncbi:MAG: hypothetical protein KAJ86_02070 [Alphaproteobacteria bacterium]|nr:hypothetical protein [Alphaproteobacteria bacterium]
MMDFLGNTTSWILFSFIIFVIVIWRFGKQAFLNMLDSRIESIRKEIKTSENLHVEAQELLAQYQRKHRDAVKDAEEIIANAKKQAAKIRKKAEQDSHEIMLRREKQLKERLERMELSAMVKIQKYTADLAIQATTEVIVKNLDKKANEKLINQSIKNIAANIH